ncbi:palladin-like [Mizuhopecten yessoensis]|uniref:Titin n=1 Tax=Mizuhopecten yessoensis TaxID=6573 RepID=A0A210PRD2_MIZYE|nr:palladin-like [Mizuhopecten yessoensis]OWF39014.1 Titin [Mizuhopecten yessoensis]
MLIQGFIALLISEIICLLSCVVSQDISPNVPTINVPGYSYLVPYGRSVMLECHVTGTRPIKVKWWTRGRHVTDDDVFHTSLVTTSDERDTLLLWIHSLSEKETGTYICSGSNAFGEVTDKIYVNGYEDEGVPGEEDGDVEIGYFTAENSARKSSAAGGVVYLATIVATLHLTTTIFSSVLSCLCNAFS